RIGEPAAQQASPRDEEAWMHSPGVGLQGQIQAPDRAGIGQRLPERDDQQEPLVSRRRDVVSADDPDTEPKEKHHRGEAEGAATVAAAADPVPYTGEDSPTDDEGEQEQERYGRPEDPGALRRGGIPVGTPGKNQIEEDRPTSSRRRFDAHGVAAEVAE